ncbi:MAG TPA: pyrimidine utilization protein D [Allosphingosinicella sp.]|nr:pyrimidine utilization protein D [Allosphingosinicella sp.]
MIAGLYFEEHGPADAPPLILSAGLGGSGAYWRPNLAALAERHRVILYDHRGTGRSDRKLPDSLSIEDMAEDVLALLDGLGIERAHFIGHAAGGLIGMALALAQPERVRRLVVVNGWGRLEPHTDRCFETRLALLRDSGPAAFVRAQPIFLYPANWIASHEAELELDAAEQLGHFPGPATVEKRIAALRAFDLQDRIGEIRAPLLAVSAEDDILVPSIASSRIVDRLSNDNCGTGIHFTWGGHACNMTDPDRFNESIPRWLAGAPFLGAS